ncbi:MAG: metallophosphoesterase [Gammaproteobacteria bacterium]
MVIRALRATHLLALPLLLAAARLVAAPIQDGPYVTRSSSDTFVARWVEGDDSAPRVREQPVAIGSEITVPAVGAIPAFKVKLRKPSLPVAAEVKLPPGTALFVMADTHGEYQIAVELLTKQKVIGPNLEWSFGKGHLAVLGDIFDRGPNHTEIFWLLYALEAQAKNARGAVHVMLGNHESMALGADERYLNPKYLKVKTALQAPDYAALWNESTVLGQWLRTKAAVMKLGDFLCLHGGISGEVVDRGLTLAQLNDSVRNSLGDRHPDGFVMSPNGPLWYRGYFPDAARESGSTVATAGDITRVLAFFNAKAIFVGHTIVPTVTPLFDGRVIAVQVYPHRDDATSKPEMQALLVKQKVFYRARIDGTTEPLIPR